METAFHSQESVEGAEPEAAIVLHDTYRLVRQLGFGGLGVVYEAVHTRLPRRFAIKVLLRSLLTQPEAHARFCGEAEIMAQLRHPHIVQIFDFNVTHENQPYFVMEYLEGRNLEDALAQNGAMPVSRALPIVDAIALALMAAHRRGVPHRDLKPSNVFLCDLDGAGEAEGDGQDRDGAHTQPPRSEDPFVKVLDFGIPKVRSAGRITLGASLVGTPRYIAPEQAAGRVDQIDARADQFSLAAIAYQMLTGHDAFTGEDTVSLLYQIVHEEPQPLSRHLSWDCRRVQQVLSRALSKDPAARFPTIVDFSTALAEAADQTPAPMTVPAARAPTAAVPPAAMLDAAASGQPWTEREITTTIPRVPRLAYRPIVLTLVTLVALGFVAAKGWIHPLPESVVVTARGFKARLLGAPAVEPSTAPVPDVREAAPPPPPPLPAEPTPHVAPAAVGGAMPNDTPTETSGAPPPAAPSPP